MAYSTPSPLKAGVQREELVFDTAKLSLTRARDGGGFDFNLQGPAPWGLTTLSVEDLSEGGGPFLVVDACEFLHPVYVGDTLTARSRVVSARESKGQAGFGIVTWHTEGLNQEGAKVIEFDRTNLVRKRGPAPASRTGGGAP